MNARRFAWSVMTFFSVGVGLYGMAVLAEVVPNDFLEKFDGYRAWANLHFFGGGIALLFGPGSSANGYVSGLRGFTVFADGFIWWESLVVPRPVSTWRRGPMEVLPACLGLVRSGCSG